MRHQIYFQNLLSTRQEVNIIGIAQLFHFQDTMIVRKLHFSKEIDLLFKKQGILCVENSERSIESKTAFEQLKNSRLYFFLIVLIVQSRLRAQSRKRNCKARYRCPLSLGGKFGKCNRGHCYRFLLVCCSKSLVLLPKLYPKRENSNPDFGQRTQRNR